MDTRSLVYGYTVLSLGDERVFIMNAKLPGHLQPNQRHAIPELIDSCHPRKSRPISWCLCPVLNCRISTS